MKSKSTLIQGAMVLLSTLLSIHPAIPLDEMNAAQYYKKGLQQFQQGCLPEDFSQDLCSSAIDKLKKAIELDPTQIDAYLALAQAYWNKSFLDFKSEQEQMALQEKAVTLYREIVAIDPNNIDAHYELTVRTTDANEKIGLLKRIIELNPRHSAAHRDLALILISRGKVDEAFKEYLTHLQVSPYRGRQDGFNHIYFARLVEKAGRRDMALEIYREILRVTADESRFERCYLFVRKVDLNRYAPFKDFVEEVQRLMPYCTKLEHRDRAVRLQREGKIDKAIEELKLQLRVNPYYPETYFLLEDIYIGRKEPDKALKVVKKYFEIEKDLVVRCKVYRRLRKQEYKRLDEQFIEQLKRECEGAKRN
ncbi:MAG: tetratricopeptide repeat protein [Candidatus Binatia bacterium]